MKRGIIVIALCLLAVPAFAQSAPNRSGEAAIILSSLPHASKTETDEGRRANLFAIVRGLTARGDCCWGVLVKTDQGNKIPADTIVWRPTLEHFDVITGDGGAFWGAHGPVSNPAWVWQAVPGTVVDPPPPPPPPPAQSCDLSPLYAQLSMLNITCAALKAGQDDHAAKFAEHAKSLEEHRADVKGFWAKYWPQVVTGTITGVIGAVTAYKAKKETAPATVPQ